MTTVTRCGVIGAGSWGTVVAGLVGTNAEAVLWGRDPHLVDAVNERHENPKYLAGIPLDPALRATSDLADACRGADVVVMAVPSHGFRDVLRSAAGAIAPGAVVVSLHDLNLAWDLATHAVLLDGRGGAIAGPREEVMLPAHLSDAFSVPIAHVEVCGVRRFWVGPLPGGSS